MKLYSQTKCHTDSGKKVMYIAICVCVYACVGMCRTHLANYSVGVQLSSTSAGTRLSTQYPYTGSDTGAVSELIRAVATHSLCVGWSRLRWGWVFLERRRIPSGIHFTTCFIEIFVAETKRFVGSFVHVILTRQICGQRSSRAAESKRRALGNYFSRRICYMFLISKCRGGWDLGLCTTSVLAFEEPQRNGKIWFFLRRNWFFSQKSNYKSLLQNMVCFIKLFCKRDLLF